jgi:CBS domain-containing protein
MPINRTHTHTRKKATVTLRVRDLMRTNLITCPPNTTLGAAAVMLTRHQVHAIVVADPSGMQQGLVSDVDLLAGEWLASHPDGLAALRTLTVEQIMTTPVATIDADAPATEAAARMRAERLHRLVVTEHERGIGVLSVADMVRVLIPDQPERQTVGGVMSRGLVVCRADTPIGAAARAMTERRSRSIVVVEANGRPLGVVSGFDLLPFILEGDSGATAADIMAAPITIGPEATLREAADRMLQHHIHRLVVVDPNFPDGMPLGLISTSDIVSEMTRGKS